MQDTVMTSVYREMMRNMVGTWTVDATISLPDGSIVPGTGTWQATEVSMGMGVRTLMRLGMEDQSMEENALWGYDEGGQRVHMLSITSEGNVRNCSGSLDEDGVLHLRWEGIAGGEPASEETVMDMRSADKIEIISVESVGGEEQVRTELTMRRR
jgi:hypothetical protein